LKILVTYFSLTNNTELIANTIFEQVSSNNEADIKKIRDVDPSQLNRYDLIFVGSACHDSDVARPVKYFLESLPENPSFKLAGFYCHSTMKRNYPFPRSEELFDRWAAKGIKTFKDISASKGIDLMGIFNCMGAPSPEIQVFIKKEIITDEEEWDTFFDEAMEHPNSKDLQDAKSFAEKVLNKVRST
jgi:flavodoxin